jgi:hypothetical protein
VLLRVAAGGIAAAALVAAVHPFIAFGAPAGALPNFSVDTVSSGSEVTWTAFDPLTTPIEAAVVNDGSSKCFGGGSHGDGCFDRISSMVDRHGAAAGFTANYNNGTDILGLAVVDHHAWAPADPHTTSLCVGDSIPGSTRPTITITKSGDATTCKTAVSGELIVANSQPDIEGQADENHKGAFWWSVEQSSPVQRTLVGLKQDGTVMIAVVSAVKAKQRNGLTLPQAARWLIDHGVVQAIALDGGHQAEAYVAGRGSIVPLQAGEPGVQVSLMLGRTVPVIPAPPATPAPAVPAAAAPAPAPAPAAPAPSHRPSPTPTPRGPVPGTGVLGSVVLPRLPESGALPAPDQPSLRPAAGSGTSDASVPQVAVGGSPGGPQAAPTSSGGLTSW